MRRARARVLNGRRRPLRDAVSEGQKKGRAFPYNNRALNTQVSQCNSNNSKHNKQPISSTLNPNVMVQEEAVPAAVRWICEMKD
ncbi:hypothetical protein NDU88_006238 [Pleurodeles waltl]|uniref:Uncharacterized protein n=1 Tax=Pleurodeles waltl TaxID=8319 RepID=A0AAV7NPP5_PLEWA|nr:hypothetical protein NDU88_006238 [Pleurodeles waltl]